MRNRIRQFIRKHDLKWKLQQLWMRRIGYRLALWLDKRHPEWCWADTCTYVGMAWDIPWLWRTSEEHKAEHCKRVCLDIDFKKNGSCWCGKNMSPEMRAGLERDAKEHKDEVPW
jgi:hypothetical protein